MSMPEQLRLDLAAHRREKAAATHAARLARQQQREARRPTVDRAGQIIGAAMRAKARTGRWMAYGELAGRGWL
jgi:hypothetical protein